jgi:hypothetical protein
VVFYDAQKAIYEFSGPFDYLKHHLTKFVQVAFNDARDVENEIARPYDTMNHRFHRLHQSRSLRHPEGIL